MLDLLYFVRCRLKIEWRNLLVLRLEDSTLTFYLVIALDSMGRKSNSFWIVIMQRFHEGRLWNISGKDMIMVSRN